MMSKTLLLLLLLSTGAFGSNLPRAGCNADNCARAVTGTRYAASVQAIHTSDCSSFMAITVTPAAPTFTKTITPTSYSVVGSNSKRTAAPVAERAGIEARQDGTIAVNPANGYAALFVPDPAISKSFAPDVTPRALVAARQVTTYPDIVPIYASACSGTVRYSSACSCAGITASTTYAPTPATVTSTVYAAPSVIPVCDPASNYGIVYIGGALDSTALADNVVLNVIFPGVTGAQSCCAACFVEGSACFLYELYGGNGCIIAIESQGTGTPTDYCPFGVYGISGYRLGGNFYGMGPCAFPG